MANSSAGEPPSGGVTKSRPNAQGAGHPPGFDLTQEPIEAAAKRAAELFVSIERGLESRRVAPAAMRSALQERFAGTLGENGVGLLSVLDEYGSSRAGSKLAASAFLKGASYRSAVLASRPLVEANPKSTHFRHASRLRSSRRERPGSAQSSTPVEPGCGSIS